MMKIKGPNMGNEITEAHFLSKAVGSDQVDMKMSLVP